jgi:hypothetical protein
MSDTKISDAAVEAAQRAIYFSASPEATEADYVRDALDEPDDAEDVKAWMRAALEAALPHLHPQPAELAEQKGDGRERFEAWAETILGDSPNWRESGNGELARQAWQAAIAATGKQQVGEVQGDALNVEQLQELISRVHGTVSLGHQTGPHAYAGEDFGRYLAEAAGDCQQIMRALAALAARQPGAPVPQGSEFVISRTLEDAEAASDGMLPAALVPVADEWYRLCERRFSVDRIRISGKLAEAIVNAVCAAPPAQGIDLGQLRDKVWTMRGYDGGDYLLRDDIVTEIDALIDQRGGEG